MTTAAGMRGARLGWALLILIGLYVAGRLLGLESLLSPERLRALVRDAGPWGPLVFTGMFVGGVLAQVPGLVFVSAAPLLFPAPEAWLLSLLAGNLAVNFNFGLVRRIGGANAMELERPWAQRLFGQLERRPVRAVALLRTVFIMFPPLTGALALTQLRARDHALGSALGITLPISALLWFEALLMW